MKNITTEAEDLLWHLIKDLKKKEKEQITNYLKAFEFPYCLDLFKAYNKSRKYSKEAIYKNSNIKGIDFFNKKRGELKFHILDFLRLKLKNERSIWRKRLDYADVLKYRNNEYFLKEAFKYVVNVLEDTEKNDSFFYFLTANLDFSNFQNSTLSKNVQELANPTDNVKKAITKIQESNDVNEWYKKTVMLFLTTGFIRSDNQHQLLVELRKDESYSRKIEVTHTKFYQTHGKILVDILLNDIDSTKNNIAEFTEFYQGIIDKKLNIAKNQQVIATYYLATANAYFNISDFKNVDITLQELKSYLDKNFPKIHNHFQFWLNYYNFIYRLKIKNQTFTNLDLKEISNLYDTYVSKSENFNAIINYQFLLMMGNFNLQNYCACYEHCEEIIKLGRSGQMCKDIQEFARLFMMVILLADLLENSKTKTGYDLQYLNIVAGTQNSYFKEQQRENTVEYYYLEKKLSYYLKNLENLDKPEIKQKLQKIYQNSQYHNPLGLYERMKTVFDFEAWIEQ